MGDMDPLMHSMLLACAVLLVVPATILGMAVFWYVRSRRLAR
jgi:hypothetical protein